MPGTKPADQVVEKWTRRAAVAQPDYSRGVQNPRTAWDTASAAADGNYRQAVTAAAAAGRYAAGVRGAGQQKWQQNSLNKGPGRYVEGVQLGQADYSKQVATVLTTIQGVTLPPRAPTGSPQNYQRVQPLGEALRRAFGKTGTAAR